MSSPLDPAARFLPPAANPIRVGAGQKFGPAAQDAIAAFEHGVSEHIGTILFTDRQYTWDEPVVIPEEQTFGVFGQGGMGIPKTTGTLIQPSANFSGDTLLTYGNRPTPTYSIAGVRRGNVFAGLYFHGGNVPLRAVVDLTNPEGSTCNVWSLCSFDPGSAPAQFSAIFDGNEDSVLWYCNSHGYAKVRSPIRFDAYGGQFQVVGGAYDCPFLAGFQSAYFDNWVTSGGLQMVHATIPQPTAAFVNVTGNKPALAGTPLIGNSSGRPLFVQIIGGLFHEIGGTPFFASRSPQDLFTIYEVGSVFISDDHLATPIFDPRFPAQLAEWKPSSLINGVFKP
jgi:hypothetical protein